MEFSVGVQKWLLGPGQGPLCSNWSIPIQGTESAIDHSADDYKAHLRELVIHCDGEV